MEVNQTNIAIGAIVILEVSMGVIGYYSGSGPDMGTIGMGITAIAGIVGYDMRNKNE